jgi:hypothetical protein
MQPSWPRLIRVTAGRAPSKDMVKLWHRIAIAVVLVVDLDGLIQVWRAGGSEEHVNVDVAVPEYRGPAGSHVGCADEYFDARGMTEPIEVDEILENATQRIPG